MGDAALLGQYEFVEPGEDIDLYRGKGALDGMRSTHLRMWISMRRELSLRWQMMNLDQPVELGSSTVSIDHHQLGPLKVPVEVNNSDGWGRIAGTEVGEGQSMVRVIAHWINVPLILPATPLTEGNHSWAGRWRLDACGWQLTLDCRPDHSQVLRMASESDEQFVMTHTAEIRRLDSAEFDAESVKVVLFAWQMAMSFALGRWVAPALPVGLNRRGRRVWEEWAPWRCDTIRGYESWWDTHTSGDLAKFVGPFIEAYLDPDQRPIVRHVAMHVISANHSGTTAEGKVMLAQAGLEYLAWVTLVLTERMSRGAYRKMSAAEHLRLLLNEAGIPVTVPGELVGVSELADREGLDGPDTVAWVRNRLVHPKDADEPYRIDGLVWQTAQLMLEYGELLLLHRLGYRGRFMRRYPPNRWAHTSEYVPWAKRD